MMGIFGPPNIEKMKAKKDIDGLIMSLGYKDEVIHKAAMQALVEIGDVAVAPLIDALKFEEWFIRKRAAEALGEIGDPRANEPLITALKDEYENVRNTVAEALKNLGADCKICPGEDSTSDEVETVLQNDASMRLEGEDRCSDSESLIDIDGNVYKTVTIGKQIWMAENLKVNRYRNGDEIPEVTDLKEWRELGTGARCVYDNDEDNAATYGYLYNWYAAVDKRNIAPEGWHVPIDAEWTILEEYLIANGYNWDSTKKGNKIAKALAAKTGWKTDNDPGTIGNDLSKNNSSGFSALPGSFRLYGGYFLDQSDTGNWWSATEHDASGLSYGRILYYGSESLGRAGDFFKGCGFSVRLLRD